MYILPYSYWFTVVIYNFCIIGRWGENMVRYGFFSSMCTSLCHRVGGGDRVGGTIEEAGVETLTYYLALSPSYHLCTAAEAPMSHEYNKQLSTKKNPIQ